MVHLRRARRDEAIVKAVELLSSLSLDAQYRVTAPDYVPGSEYAFNVRVCQIRDVREALRILAAA